MRACACVCACERETECLCGDVLSQSEIASLKADNERLQTVIAEKAGIDGAELLRQTSAHAASAADVTSG